MSDHTHTLNPVQAFQLFCLENYKNVKGITASSALDIFKKNDVFGFLASGYDVLHTQSKNFILNQISDYIDNYEALSRKH